MEKIEQLVEIIKRLIRESDDRIMNIRGGKGYGTGHPYPNRKGPRPTLGDPGPYEVDEKDDDSAEQVPVQISKAFKKKEGI
jgi:hypothetical protein